MWQKGKYGLYSNWVMYFPDETGWYVGLNPEGSANFSTKSGWPTFESEYLGAALVAPLNILFWEKE